MLWCTRVRLKTIFYTPAVVSSCELAGCMVCHVTETKWCLFTRLLYQHKLLMTSNHTVTSDTVDKKCHKRQPTMHHNYTYGNLKGTECIIGKQLFFTCVLFQSIKSVIYWYKMRQSHKSWEVFDYDYVLSIWIYQRPSHYATDWVMC